MQGSTIVFWTLLAIAVFGVASRALRIPYPIVMVIGGALLALVPGIPAIRIPPDAVFLILLPPLLFGGAWQTDPREFREFLEPILLLALGLVIFTTVVLAYFAHAFMGVPLAAAFVLGAVLSPPDAIATEAIADEVPFPRGISAILSGESLINDATALVIYRFAVAAVLTGTFSFAFATLQFAYVSIAGVAIGFVIAQAVAWVLIRLRNAEAVDGITTTVVTIVMPFVVYLPAEALHASGVLATVAAGITLSRRSSELFDSELRLTASGFWETLTFLLNGVAFLAIGIQLPSVFSQLSKYSPETLALYGAATCAIVIGARFALIFVLVTLRKSVGRRAGLENEFVPWQRLFVLSWAGMRGIVTLAAALSIPATTATGAPFPDRALILYLAFVTIVVTLVGQGLTLPFVMRVLAVSEPASENDIEAVARLRTARAARETLRALEPTFSTTQEWEIAGRLIGELDQRIGHFQAEVDGTDPPGEIAAHARDRELQRAVCDARRACLEDLRKNGEINARVFRELQFEIDLTEAQLRT